MNVSRRIFKMMNQYVNEKMKRDALSAASYFVDTNNLILFQQISSMGNH